MTGLAVEALLAVLLLLTIIYCVRLDQRLGQLRKGNDGMVAAARELSETISQAEAAVQGLRQLAQDAGRDLQAQIDRAQTLANTLSRNTSRKGY